MSKIWIISDQHFNHVNICGPSLSRWNEGYRNFNSLKEMEDCIVDNTNSLVQPNDTIYDLGDVFMGQVAVHAKRIMDRFKCKNRHLIYGNHDKVIKKTPELQKLFSSCQLGLELYHKGKLVVMFHYPIASWNEMGKGSIHCYGHVHDSYNHYGRSYNVGVDVNGFKPVLLDDIIDICSAKPLDLIDHHSPETTY